MEPFTCVYLLMVDDGEFINPPRYITAVAHVRSVVVVGATVSN